MYTCIPCILSAEEFILSNCHAVILEKTLKSLLESKEIKPVNPKENQS